MGSTLFQYGLDNNIILKGKLIMEDIIKSILSKFPNLKIKVEEFNHDYFISINNDEIYNSEEYLKFITRLKYDLFKQKGVVNAFFV